MSGNKRNQENDMTSFQKFMSENLFPLFQKADRRQMEKALKTRKISEICKVLGISEKDLAGIIIKGAKLARISDVLKLFWNNVKSQKPR